MVSPVPLKGLKRYEPLNLLGKGAYAKVFAAWARTMRLTRCEIAFLDRMLQPGGLRPFLQRHDAYFNFGLTPSGKWICFHYVPKW